MHDEMTHSGDTDPGAHSETEQVQQRTRFVGTARRKLVDFFFSSRRRHTRCSRDWSSDVCSSDLIVGVAPSEFEVENILWIEPEIHARENKETAHQEACADQQYDRQSDFGHDKKRAKLSSAKPYPGPLARACEVRLHIAANDMQSGRKAAQNGAQKGDA